MTDRELLESAARAIGAKPYVDRAWPGLCLSDDPECLPFTVNAHGADGRTWNPLADDGDALRLSVTLNMACAPGVASWKEDRGQQHTIREGDTDYAATRRAIVRAAAEIGKEVGAPVARNR